MNKGGLKKGLTLVQHRDAIAEEVAKEFNAVRYLGKILKEGR